ncbi:hypothetical protein, partial [Sphingomonas hankyongi]
ASGTTYFDGIINPSAIPGYDRTDRSTRILDATALDSGLAGPGTLTIDDGGNLVLADTRVHGDPTGFEGPTYALVDTFNVGADGTITFQLVPESGGDQEVGTYAQVFANTANLDGTLVADIQPANGLFADDYFWDNVIDAEVRNGGFDGAQCQIGGAFGGSLFLNLDCIEDESDNIDLAFTRTPFDEIPGLTENGQSTSEGLECIYDPDLTGGIADLFNELFQITDPVDYQNALDQLAGASYANYLESFSSLGVHYNDILDHATSCEIPSLAGSV